MSKFRQAMGSLIERGHTKDLLLAAVADEVSGGDPPACLQGHLALTYELIDNGWDGIKTYPITNSGALGHYSQFSSDVKQRAEQYVADCKLMARIIVEQFSDRLKYDVPVYEKNEDGAVFQVVDENGYSVMQSVDMYVGEDYSSWEAMVDCDPHSIISNFNDHDDTGVEDCLLVLEKAAIQSDEFVMFAEEMNAEFTGRA